MDSQIERLRAQKEYYKTKAINLELEKERLQSEILRLFNSKGFRDTQILELQNNLVNARSQERNLQARYNALEAEHLDLEQVVSRLSVAYTSKEQDLVEATRQLTRTRVQINNLQSEILD